MSIFGDILHKIFPGNHPAVTNPTPSVASAGTSGTGTASAAPVTPSAPQAQATPASMPPVDVEAVLTAMAEKNPQKLNWRTSIVDLMKLLDLDSGLGARKELAHEIGYTGDTNDSATMNIWLHKQVMNKLAANGGKVPADLKG
jgi:hypothetical protein